MLIIINITCGVLKKVLQDYKWSSGENENDIRKSIANGHIIVYI